METSASYEARSAPSPYPTSVRSGGIFAILCRYAMLRSCWRSAVSTSTTQRSGAGCNTTAPSWSSDCENISSRQTSLGEWTKPTVRPANVARLYGGALLEHVWDAVLDDFAIRACLFSAARENEPKRR